MLTSSITTHTFSLEEVKKAIAKEIGVDPSKTEIEIVQQERGDDRFGQTWKEVAGVKITVKN